ncbi:adenylate cyclase [Apiospora marii]|uniref:adenylate cyclase n=1 Tax=Apiospora marii TaxID=335849 RepID=UPI00312F9A20
MSRNNHDDSAAAKVTDPERVHLILPEAPRHGSESEPDPEPEPAPAPLRKRLVLVAACMLLILLLELGAYLATIPLTQVLEENICRAFHPSPTPTPAPAPAPSDPRCKGNDVQTELSLIRGWQSTLDYIPSLLTAVPYGFLADRGGRELVLRLSLIGITLASGFVVLVCSLPEVFPPRATWASAIFTFIGGGPAVFNAMVFTIAADIVSEEQRSTIFSYLAAAVIGGELIASPLVYLVMERSLWLPIYLGMGCLVVATIIPVFLAETLSRQPRRQPPESQQPLVSWLETVRQETKKLDEAMRWLTWGNWKVSVLLCTFLLTMLGRFAQEILLQYVTRRYHWSWSKASLLLSIRAALNLALLLIIIPSASHVLVHWRSHSVQRSNLLLAWASAMLLAAGAFVIGLAETSLAMACGLAVFALGAGYNSLVRSLLASLVEQRHAGMLYTAVSIFETAGVLVAGPLLAFCFRTGLDWGGPWIGLPYLAAGCLFAVAAAAVGFMGLAGRTRDDWRRGRGIA